MAASARSASGAPGWVAGSTSTSIAANDLALVVYGCPPFRPGLFFYGAFQTQIPFGEGYLCTTGNQHRLQPALRTDDLGNARYFVDFTDPGSAASLIQPGMELNFQFWYRDPQTVGHGFNLSNALHAEFCP